MTATPADRVAAASGVVFVVGAVVSAVIVPTRPDTDATAGAIRSYLADHHAALSASTAIFAVAVLALAVFLGFVHQRLAAHDTAGTSLPSVFALSAAGASAVAAIGLLLDATLVQWTEQGIEDSSLLLLDRVRDMVWFNGPPLLLAVALGAAAVMILRDGAFPAWIGWLGALAALVGGVTTMVSLASTSDAFDVAGFVGFALSALWVLSTSLSALAGRSPAVRTVLTGDPA